VSPNPVDAYRLFGLGDKPDMRALRFPIPSAEFGKGSTRLHARGC
jgi:hypothetical protein